MKKKRKKMRKRKKKEKKEKEGKKEKVEKRKKKKKRKKKGKRKKKAGKAKMLPVLPCLQRGYFQLLIYLLKVTPANFCICIFSKENSNNREGQTECTPVDKLHFTWTKKGGRCYFKFQ